MLLWFNRGRRLRCSACRLLRLRRLQHRTSIPTPYSNTVLPMGWAALRLPLLALLVAPATQHRPPPKFPPQLPTTTVQASVASTLRDVPNAFGLIDMIGNIWELCGDGLASGGCCASHPYAMDLRAELPAPGRPAFIGLRLARSVPEALFDHA